LRAVLYHRVSRLDQDPSLARDELRAAATARGFSIAFEIEETGTGARNDRPGLIRVLKAAQRGEISALFVWKLDRFGRSALDVLTNIRTLKAAGCRFCATSQGIDVHPKGDPVSSLLLTVLAAVAEFEREQISERTILGLDGARRKGKRLGRPPLLPDFDLALHLHRYELANLRAVGAAMGCSAATLTRLFQKRGLKKGDRARLKASPKNDVSKTTVF